MKTEIRKKEKNAGLMETWSYTQYAGETERETERENRKLYYKNSNSMFCTCECVQCTLLYKSLQGLTEVQSYFNAH